MCFCCKCLQPPPSPPSYIREVTKRKYILLIWYKRGIKNICYLVLLGYLMVITWL